MVEMEAVVLLSCVLCPGEPLREFYWGGKVAHRKHHNASFALRPSILPSRGWH